MAAFESDDGSRLWRAICRPPEPGGLRPDHRRKQGIDGCGDETRPDAGRLRSVGKPPVFPPPVPLACYLAPSWPRPCGLRRSSATGSDRAPGRWPLPCSGLAPWREQPTDEPSPRRRHRRPQPAGLRTLGGLLAWREPPRPDRHGHRRVPVAGTDRQQFRAVLHRSPRATGGHAGRRGVVSRHRRARPAHGPSGRLARGAQVLDGRA